MDEKTKQNMKQMMSHILEVRYSNIEEEKRLCLELLELAEENEDKYAKAFAYTYLGDYSVAINDMENIGLYLKKAEDLIEKGSKWDRLLVRIYSLLGIYYEVFADEQQSIQYYLDAINIAQKIKDTQTECTVLNNLAEEFKRNKCYDTAMKYHLKAYDLQKGLKEGTVRFQIISNLAEMYLKLGEADRAWELCMECEEIEADAAVREEVTRKNWCAYYAAIGDREKARDWAGLILDDISPEYIREFGSFENFDMLCDSMLKIKDEEYSKKFLDLMIESCIDTLEQRQFLEEKRLRYADLFGSDKEKAEAYRRYYEKTRELKRHINNSVSKAMKDKLYLKELEKQKEKLQLEQDNLEKQANQDELTGIYNRRYLEKQILKHVKGEFGQNCGIIMVDADYFKEYNDFYGHLEGDHVLQTIADCLKENQTEGIQACRYGGDEFTCICDGKTDMEIESYIEAVRQDLYDRCLLHEKSSCSDRVTLSIGYSNRALTRRNGIHFLMQLADQALYDSKLSGRNSFRKR